MITDKEESTDNDRKPFWGYLLLIMGVGLNLLSIFTDDSAALVAIGCSLIAIGAATSGQNKSKKS